MATYEQRMNGIHPTQKPESLFNPAKQVKSIGSAALSVLKTLGQQLLAFLSHGSELQIWQTQNRSGEAWWNVYDPITQQTVRLLSEMEVRIWIEQRYRGNADSRS
ncbi:MAG: hypothetical protein SFY66_24290 [Oculatellaceae cyanobacterium bins.114]|nr:hypothetical protein [Oculatellaceae cyanobacterium bins.114]